MARVILAIQACQGEYLASAEAVIQRTRSLGAIEAATRGSVLPTVEASSHPPVQVPLPDLGRFDQLLSSPSNESHTSVFYT